MKRRSARVQERCDWLLEQFVSDFHNGHIGAWDQEFVEAFVERFPEAKKSLIYYTLGPNICPMLNRTAILLRDAGYLKPYHNGQDTIGGQKRTWYRIWVLTKDGWDHCRSLWPQKVSTIAKCSCTTFQKLKKTAPV